MVFGRAQWIVDCPFDHYLQYLFSGEELLLSICLFTKVSVVLGLAGFVLFFMSASGLECV